MVKWTVFLRDEERFKSLLLEAKSVERDSTNTSRIIAKDDQGKTIATFNTADVVGYLKRPTENPDITAVEPGSEE